jgi:hypothetical protein
MDITRRQIHINLLIDIYRNSFDGMTDKEIETLTDDIPKSHMDSDFGALTDTNVDEWQKELSRIATPWFGPFFGDWLTHAGWLEIAEGETPPEHLREEIRAAQ